MSNRSVQPPPASGTGPKRDGGSYMLRSHGIRISLVAGCLLLVATASSAQSTLRVLRSAVVVAEPAGDASVVGTVVAGEVLELLDERGSWYLVRPPDDDSERVANGLDQWSHGRVTDC